MGGVTTTQNATTHDIMSEWSEGGIRNKNSLVLWGSVTVIAFIRYLYDSRCGERRGLVGPVDPEEPEVQSRNRAAGENLINLLDETTRVRQLNIIGT